jgi:thiol:disulfide interchange protein
VLKPTTEGIAWYESEYLMPVLEEAQKQGKLVFLTFHASWCAPCKVMEEEVFSQQSVADYLNTHFLSYRADFDTPNGKRIADIFGVSTLPSSLFVNGQGIAVQRKTGMLTISDVFRLGDAARK